jgi:hypothetical protein
MKKYLSKQIPKLLLLGAITLNLCFSCKESRLVDSIKNCTNDTLILELSRIDTLDGSDAYWFRDSIYKYLSPNDTVFLDSEDTTMVNIHGKNVCFLNYNLIKPGDIYYSSDTLCYLDTAYIYAIKWQTAKKYTIDEIRAKKLFVRKTVTKTDFTNHLFNLKKRFFKHNTAIEK